MVFIKKRKAFEKIYNDKILANDIQVIQCNYTMKPSLKKKLKFLRVNEVFQIPFELYINP